MTRTLLLPPLLAALLLAGPAAAANLQLERQVAQELAQLGLPTDLAGLTSHDLVTIKMLAGKASLHEYEKRRRIEAIVDGRNVKFEDGRLYGPWNR